MNKKYLIIIIVYLVMFIPVLRHFNSETEEGVRETIELPKPIIIELTGEVAYPGMYTFYDSVNLESVLSFAGGITSDADLIKINYYEVFNSSKKVVIAKKVLIDDNDNNTYKIIDLNKVSFSELLSYDFMTETRAANIIIYRNQNGRFNDVNDLINVKGIGSVTFEKIYKYFKV